MTLVKDEKLQIIASHKRNLEYRKYNIELDVMLENAKSSPSSEALASFNSSLSEIDDQLEVLAEETAKVNALTE